MERLRLAPGHEEVGEYFVLYLDVDEVDVPICPVRVGTAGTIWVVTERAISLRRVKTQVEIVNSPRARSYARGSVTHRMFTKRDNLEWLQCWSPHQNCLKLEMRR